MMFLHEDRETMSTEWKAQVLYWLTILKGANFDIQEQARQAREVEVAARQASEERAQRLEEATGSAWLQQKLRALSKEDKDEIQRRVMARIDQIAGFGV